MGSECSPPPTQPRPVLSSPEVDSVPSNRPAPTTPTPDRGRSLVRSSTSTQPRPVPSDRSPTLEIDSVPSNHSAPPTPTSGRGRSSVRTPAHATEPLFGEALPDDVIFQEHKTRLRSLTTLATFKWDAEHSEGIFVPIPYPLDDEGNPVEPPLLLEFLKKHHWEHPSCFCAIRGTPRKAKFVASTWRDSTPSGPMCLVCSSLQCPYFVNVTRMMDLHKHEVLSVKNTNHAEDSGSSGSDTPVKVVKKRKRNLRGKRKDMFTHNDSSSNGSLLADNHQSPGLALALSHLFGRHGIHRDQFFKEFRMCNYCQRVVCNETSRVSGHTCVIEIVD